MGALLAHVGPGDEVILPSCSFSFTAEAIVSVHYAGVACEMDTLVDIARRHGLMVIWTRPRAMVSPAMADRWVPLANSAA
jgi:dTDP-4-amino-4,6-dideoxygalactose transaminase